MQNFYTIFITIIIAGGLSYFAYKMIKNYSPPKKDFIENGEYYKNPKLESNVLLIVYANWCPHSKDALFVWDELPKDKRFKKFKLKYVKIDGEDKENKSYLKEFKIKEYPTVILLKNNMKYIFDANLEPDTLLNFLNTIYDLK